MQKSQEDGSHSEVVASVVLRYPTIPVHGTPTSWLSQSQLVTMTSTHDDSCDDTSSSLGDSSYDFIDERSNASTDYEDQDVMTESTTSSDEHGFDRIDIPSQQPVPNDRVEQISQGQASVSSSVHATIAESESVPSEPDSEDQVSSEHIDPCHMADQHEIIQFDEPSVVNLNSSRFSEVSHTLQIVVKQEQMNAFYKNILDHLPGQLAVNVKQTMTPYSLTPEGGSYKILYVGQLEHRDPVVQKMGTALAASLKCSTPDTEKFRSSKFNIVPISGFGEAASPEVVLIDSSGLELNVEECYHASFTRMDDGNDTLQLRMNDGTSVESIWTGSRFALSNDWKLPDIAIFCVPENESRQLKQTRQFARSLMSRHAVQSIVISQTPQWDRSPTECITLDLLTPHISLEARKSNSGAAQLIRRYPVDLATFLNIDAGQLNRNLACLAVAQGSPRPRSQRLGHKKLGDSRVWSFWGWLESFVSDGQEEGPKISRRYESMSGFAFILMTVLPLLLVGIGLSGFLGASKVSNSRVFPTNAVSSTTSAPTIPTASFSLSSTTALVATTVSSTSAHVSPVSSLSSNTDIASFLLDAYMLAPNKSEQFKVHVLGDCHIVLRPPYWFSKMKKPPKLLFKVLHGGTELKHQLTFLFDGVYALQIPREDAHGLLNVSIWTDSKPRVNESFEVDFGSSWLKVAGWKRATRALTESIRDDLNSMQTSLSIVYDRTKTEISTFVKQQKEKAKAQKAADKAFIRSRYKTAVKTKELIVAQTRDLARDFSGKLHDRRAVISQQIKASAGNFTKDLSLYTRNKTSVISKQAQVLARAATGLDVKALAQDIRDFKRRHLRETQKLALKTWWKVGGVPKQRRMKVKTKGKGGSRR
ncbi:hypothetical protein N7G274_000082 [Stereocaulon virgatum]|uniref:Uncharacterized protein n=1 Tax=Stereocaulon virgatum TaxID=373712 RepID=A0ABR4ATN2_9LECA